MIPTPLASKLEPFNPMSLEDPVRPDNFDAIAAVAALAEAHHCSLVPHNPLSPVATNAVPHLCASTDNIAIAEYSDPFAASAADKLMGNKVVLRQADMVDCLPELKNGYLAVPQTAGLGIRLIPVWRTNFRSAPIR